jgi:hypothetical protein
VVLPSEPLLSRVAKWEQFRLTHHKRKAALRHAALIDSSITLTLPTEIRTEAFRHLYYNKMLSIVHTTVFNSFHSHLSSSINGVDDRMINDVEQAVE